MRLGATIPVLGPPTAWTEVNVHAINLGSFHLKLSQGNFPIPVANPLSSMQ